jgi:hypothetical protein
MECFFETCGEERGVSKQGSEINFAWRKEEAPELRLGRRLS